MVDSEVREPLSGYQDTKTFEDDPVLDRLVANPIQNFKLCRRIVQDLENIQKVIQYDRKTVSE